MKLLIGVTTCWPNIEAAEAIRHTWARSSPVPVKFFFGYPKGGFSRKAAADELFLSVLDDYPHHIHKVQAMFRYAQANGFTHVWKADDDAYLAPERLLKTNLLKHDHVGMLAQQTRVVKGDVKCKDGKFIHGGASYIVGECSLAALCKAPVEGLSEDGWTSNTIARAGIMSVHDKRFSYAKRIFGEPLPPVPTPDNDLIAGGELHTLADGRSEMYPVYRKMTGLGSD